MMKEGYMKRSVNLSFNLLVASLKEMSPYSNILILSRVDNLSTLVSDSMKLNKVRLA